MQSAEINELATALSKFQGELMGAKKKSDNPFFRSKYADLAEIWKTVSEPLAKHGLAVIQTMDCDESETPIIVTTLTHTSGQYISGRLKVTGGKKDPQGIGSAITYGRRYSLSAILGVYQEDDDAESAHGRGSSTSQKAPSGNARPSKAKMNITALTERIEATDSLPELRNVWKKYSADIGALSAEDKAAVAKIKDAKKQSLMDNLKGCE